MARKNVRAFLAIINEEQAAVSLEGPMSDDTAWIDAVYAAQRKGRAVRCCRLGDDREAAIMWFSERRWTLVDSMAVLRGSKSVTPEGAIEFKAANDTCS